MAHLNLLRTQNIWRLSLLLWLGLAIAPVRAELDVWTVVASPGPAQFLNVAPTRQVQLMTINGVLYLGGANGLSVRSMTLPAAPKLMSAGFQKGALSSGGGRVLYAVVDGHGVYRSADSGSTWAPIPAVLPAGTITAIAGAPNDPNYVYVGMASGKVYEYSSFDGIWEDLTLSLPAAKVYRLAVAPNDSGRVYAAIEGQGIYLLVAPNRSRHWVKVSDLNGIQDIAIHPANGYEALLSSGGTVERIYATDVGGRSWPLRNGLPGGALMGGLVYDPLDHDFAYLGTTRGMYKFNRGLGSWSRLGADGDLANKKVVAVGVDPRDTDVVYAATNDDLGGGRLYRIEQSLPSNLPPQAVININTLFVQSFDTVVLDGASSIDPDGQIISYKWSETSGITIAINGDDSAITSFVAPDVTKPITLRFQLEVLDNKNAWAGAQAEVVVAPHGYSRGVLGDEAEFGVEGSIGNGDVSTRGGGGSLGWGLLPLALLVAYRWHQRRR